jgi:hypothetical protein
MRPLNLLINPYVLIPLGLAAGSVFPHAASRLESSRAPGVAAYDVDYEIATPTTRLVKTVFGESVRRLTGRPTLVLLGNSILQGRGALDKQTLNTALSSDRDVINAALGGENLIASSALAAYAIDSLPAGRIPPRVDVVLLYPGTRFYSQWGYSYFSSAVAGLCRESARMRDLPECAQAKAEPRLHDALRDAKNWVLARTRCVATQQEVLEALRYGGFRCQSLFQREAVTAGFLHEYARTLSSAPFSRADVEDLYRVGSLYADYGEAAPLATAAVEHLASLRGVLTARGIPARFHILILRESPKFLGVLTPAERTRLQAAAETITKVVQEKAPWARAKIIGPYAPNDYFDPTHLRESGQAQLALEILALTHGN